MDTLLSAFSLVATVPTIVAIVAGTLLGIVMGVLLGLGPALAVSLALPFTFGLDKMTSIAMLLGLYVGSIYGGSITAILITDWVHCVNARLTVYQADGTTEILTWTIAFRDAAGSLGGAPEHLPYRIDIDLGGLLIPAEWVYKFHCTNGQFDATLFYRGAL